MLPGHADEALEQTVAVLRAGAGLGVVLYGEDGLAFYREPAVRAVEKRAIGLDDAFGQRIGIDGEAVVHRDDLDLARFELLHRMVRAVVALVHLERPGAKREAKQLMPEADAEEGDARIEKLADDRRGVLGRGRRIARPVGQEDAVGPHGEDVGCGRVARHHAHTGARVRQEAQNVALGAVVERHDMRALALAGLPVPLSERPRRLAPFGSVRGRGGLGEVEPFEAAPFGGLGLEGLPVEAAVGRVRDDGVERALLAQPRRQRPRVDACHGNDAACAKPLVEGGRRAVRGWRGRSVAEHRSHGAMPGVRRKILAVLAVRADIADMRKGEGDDLVLVGGVGKDLLIARHGRVEDELGHHLATRARSLSLDHGAVGQNEQRRRLARRPGGGSLVRQVVRGRRVGRRHGVASLSGDDGRSAARRRSLAGGWRGGR